MPWKYYRATEAFDRFASEWDRLNQVQHNHILLDSRFIRPLLKHFGSDQVLLGVSEDSEHRGMALVSRKKLGIWETFQPAQAPLGLIIADKHEDPLGFLDELLRSLPGPGLQLGILQQDPDFPILDKISNGPRTEIQDYIKTARMNLVGSYEEYWSTRSKNLRHNLARQRKRLAEQGRHLELVVLRESSSINQAVSEFGRLESKGWKGREGTAIAEDNAQGRFYREMLEAFCATSEGIVYQLLLDGKVVASDLGLMRSGMLVVLKTTYDETLQQVSPALLMREEILQRLYQDKTVRVVEFYGKVLDWHLKWTNDVRTMYHVNYFRNRWIARLRGLIKSIR